MPHTVKLSCAVDRIENGTAVIIPDGGGSPFEISALSFPGLIEGQAYTAVFEDGVIRAMHRRESGTDNAARLKNMFDKSKDINSRGKK